MERYFKDMCNLFYIKEKKKNIVWSPHTQAVALLPGSRPSTQWVPG